ncbi:MauE/DoxX family redox-associated membrane protein [Knoellia subterranea]|uniref:DoxX family protein n=1 Tax=Knoellia subterranea KCTC 19937 TaxID=1385521 RepID=A0A0A0JNT8_9MICO|nr:MauE/DoxX family redox-associated membrane protein [Knoellia subterranea]KGN38818.1 DoxX family protein [Knoellia subterranea KCTC 19937]
MNTRVADGLGLIARLVLGAVFLVAGGLKVTTPEALAKATQAYQVLPHDLAAYVGYALPTIEIVLGLLLVLGLFTRISAAITSLLLVAFIIGIAQAWERGLTIDCGCFGGGGAVSAEDTSYLPRILEDLGLLACGLWLSWRPTSFLSLDRLLFGAGASDPTS